jgi:predicted metal-binding protein
MRSQRTASRQLNSPCSWVDCVTDSLNPLPFPGPVTLHVCVTCRPPDGPEVEADRPGSQLYRALQARLAQAEVPLPIHLEAARCLSVCKRPCTVAVSSPGRWSYIYGDLDPTASLDALLDGICRYAATSDGIVPWRERPQEFRKGVIARVPPLNSLPEAAE